MGGGRGALSTLPRNETCGPPLCHLYGADRRDAEEPAARQLEWRVASEQEVTTLRPVGRISAHDRRLLGAAASRCPLWGHSRPGRANGKSRHVRCALVMLPNGTSNNNPPWAICVRSAYSS